MGNLLTACVSEQHTEKSTASDGLPEQDLLAFLQCLQEAGPLSRGILEARLAQCSHAILMVEPSSVPPAAAARSPSASPQEQGGSSKQSPLSYVSVSPYVEMVKRLEKVAASPAEGGKSGSRSIAAQLEAINKKQLPKGRSLLRDGSNPTWLTLIYSNAAAQQVLGADKIKDWVDVHISQNPMLLCQLSYKRKNKAEVYQHLVPAQDGGFLQLDAVVCPIQGVNTGAVDTLQTLLIRLQHQPSSLSRYTPSRGLQPLLQQHQQHQQTGWPQGRPHKLHKSKSLDIRKCSRRSIEGPGAVPPSRQCLYQALANLPMAVTLLNPSGQIVWQNGRSAALFGLARLGLDESSCNLRRIFSLDPEALDSLLLALKKEEAWTGLIQVCDEELNAAAAAFRNEGAANIHATRSFTCPEHLLRDSNIVSTDDLPSPDKDKGPRRTPGYPSAFMHFSSQTGACALPLSTKSTVPAADTPIIYSPAEQSIKHWDTWLNATCCGISDQADEGTQAPGGFSFPDALPGATAEATSVVVPMYGSPYKASDVLGPGTQANKANGLSDDVPLNKVSCRTASPEHARQGLPKNGSGPLSGTQKEALPTGPSAVGSATASLASLSALRASSCTALMGRASRPLPGPSSRLQLGVGALHTSNRAANGAKAQELSERLSDKSQLQGADGPRPRNQRGGLPALAGRHVPRRGSLLTSCSLHDLDEGLPAASRALQMSTSPPSSMMHPLSRTSNTVANCSLNWLAHTQDQVTSGAHYINTIPEVGGTKSTHESASNPTTSCARMEVQAQDLGPMDHNCIHNSGPTSSPSQVPTLMHGLSLPADPLTFQPCSAGSRGGLGAGDALSAPANGIHSSARDKVEATFSSLIRKSEVTSGVRGLHSSHSSLRRKSEATLQVHNLPLSYSNPLGTQQQQQEQQQTLLNAAMKKPVTGSERSRENQAMQGSLSTNTIDPHGSTISTGQDNVEPSPCWHHVDAFHIKGPNKENLMVLTNQDVTHWVDAQMSLKQILDVEHKILENIFPKHILESQVAACTEASFGRSQASRPLSKVGSHQSLANSWDHGHRSPGDMSPLTTENLACADPWVAGMDANRVAVAAAGNCRPFQSMPQIPAPKAPQTMGLTCVVRNALPQVHYQIGSFDGSTPNDTSHINSILETQEACDSFEQQAPPEFGDIAMQKAPHGGPAGDSSTKGPVRRGNSSRSLMERAQGPPSQTRCSDYTSNGPPLSRCSMSRIQLAQGPSSRSSSVLSPFTFDNEGSSYNGRALHRSPPKPHGALSGMGRYHENVTIMFADIKNFTAMSRAVSSAEVMHFLHTLFSQFDSLVDSMEDLGLYKVETIGDCYMCAAGLLTRGDDGAMTIWEGDGSPVHHLFKLATDMLKVASDMEMPASGGQPVVLRIGMHTGPCVSGIVGTKMPRFCLYGDTVNFAARMESACKPGMVHVSQATWEALGPPDLDADPHWSATPGVEAKGIGFVKTYLWSNEAVVKAQTT